MLVSTPAGIRCQQSIYKLIHTVKTVAQSEWHCHRVGNSSSRVHEPQCLYNGNSTIIMSIILCNTMVNWVQHRVRHEWLAHLHGCSNKFMKTFMSAAQPSSKLRSPWARPCGKNTLSTPTVKNVSQGVDLPFISRWYRIHWPYLHNTMQAEYELIVMSNIMLYFSIYHLTFRLPLLWH